MPPPPEGRNGAPAGRDPGWWRTTPGALREVARLDAQAGAAGRYRVKRRGRERVLVCLEAPTLEVRIAAGVTVSAAAARGAPPGTIFLDGAAQGEPFLDAERDVYNLDHHEGCVRAFTLATCEQAMVLLRRGLDLRRRDFRVHANGVDLDTVLAIWVLLNHLRLGAGDAAVRRRVLPLLRLEGNIDALGFGCEELCALPEPLLLETRRALDALLERERSARAGGFGRDPLAFVAAQLRAVDRIAYAGEAPETPLEIEELARSELPGLGVAVVCRAAGGVYEVERELRRLHGERLALLVLQKDVRTYSLRAASPAAAARLPRIYDWLNHADPGSGGARSARRWGGGAEIGGSPRPRGTRLRAAEIARICAAACARPGPAARLRAVLGAAAGACALLALGTLPLALGAAGGAFADAGGALGGAGGAALGSFVVAGLACLARARRSAGWLGLRWPHGAGGLAALPVALAAAAAGGVWLPLPPPAAPLEAAALPPLATLLAGALGLELLFRGVAFARLAPACGARAGLALSALLFAAALAVLPAAAAPLGGPAGGAFAALAFGAASGWARLRSESLALPLAFAALGLAARLAWLGG